MKSQIESKKISTFYFINYNKDDAISSVLPFVNTSTICLDLEDSVQDLFNPVRNFELKQAARNSIRRLFSESKISDFDWAVRISSFHSEEIDNDIKLLSEERIKNKIRKILIPKTESINELEQILLKLQKSKIEVEEIIPIIETKRGLNNLKEICSLKGIKRIAFGHCDFNHDSNFFPFYHQSSKKYWEWIKDISLILQASGIQFLNSPFLKFNDDYEFQSMLAKLNSICKADFGQITLTKRQTELCKNFHPEKFSLNGFDKQLNNEEVLIYAKKIINNFETYNDNKGFTISSERILISPHEYIAAKEFLKKKTINICIAGGCFPAQSNIAKEKLYHSIVKRKLEEESGNELLVNIVRYERFKNCFEKIKEHVENNKTDVLLFHLRIEQVLRIAKLVYKYSEGGKVKRKFTLPFLNKIPSEKIELLQKNLGQPNTDVKKPAGLKKMKLNLNYFLGMLFGNVNYAFNKYDEIYTRIIQLCEDKNIKLILVGPACRPYNNIEDKLSKKLSEYFKLKAEKENIPFINLLGYSNEKKENLFFENGIHVSEAGHERAAILLLNELNKIYST